MNRKGVARDLVFDRDLLNSTLSHSQEFNPEELGANAEGVTLEEDPEDPRSSSRSSLYSSNISGMIRAEHAEQLMAKHLTVAERDGETNDLHEIRR